MRVDCLLERLELRIVDLMVFEELLPQPLAGLRRGGSASARLDVVLAQVVPKALFPMPVFSFF